MQMDGKKKVLFVMGIGDSTKRILEKMTNIGPRNSLILPNYESVISPFGDVMRNILLSVYQENIEEIFIVVGKENPKKAADILRKIQEHKEMQEKIQTLDYLFKNCMPEFAEGTIVQWLTGRKITSDCARKSVNVIRNHPLMPSNVNVSGLVIDPENETLSEIRVS
ncbi:carbonic anhydrase [Neobacillus sp. SM06]|uniref:carbonic anhydrase n=1 Tax=Neobacillus sp. SM06 TaxID=3422492 RepID=UPI003D271B43